VDRGGTDIPAIAGLERFDPEWRLYARSASDDKAPIVAICAALDALAASSLGPT
jgi:acetylornithine deacetylase/succinyl-diaminopimelate desuccinylase-like protein